MMGCEPLSGADGNEAVLLLCDNAACVFVSQCVHRIPSVGVHESEVFPDCRISLERSWKAAWLVCPTTCARFDLANVATP